MQWIKNIVPMHVNGLDSIEDYVSTREREIIHVMKAGGFNSESVLGQRIEHYVIGKFFMPENNREEPVTIEPNYAEKITILKDLGKWKRVALEVMPPEEEVIDREDVYHIWEFEYPYSFFLNVQPIFTPPDCLDGLFEDIHYKMIRQGHVFYVYFRSDKEVTWRNKQNLKNFITAKEFTAVEIITESMLNADYGAMIILPFKQHLDFGLC